MSEEPTERDALIRSTLVDVVSAASRLTRVAALLAGGTESPAIWRTLAVLSTSGPMRLGMLAAQSRVSQPTMTNLVHSLEESGWVARIPDPADARAALVTVTDAGSAAVEEWRQRLGLAMLPLFADITDEQLSALAQGAELIHSRIADEIERPANG